MWISRRIVGLTVFAFTVVSACASAGPSSVAPSTSPSPGASAAIGIAGPTWMVTTIGGSDTVADARPTMTFGADGQVQGSGGCNSYGGPYNLDGPAIERAKAHWAERIQREPALAGVLEEAVETARWE